MYEKIGNSNNSKDISSNPNSYIMFGNLTKRMPSTGTDAKKETPFNPDTFADGDLDLKFDEFKQESELYHKFSELTKEQMTALLVRSKPINQLKYITLLCETVCNEPDLYGIGIKDPYGYISLLEKLSKNKDAVPLVRIAARNSAISIREFSEMSMYGDFYIEDIDDEDKKLQREAKRARDFGQTQDRDTRFLFQAVYNNTWPLKPLVDKVIGFDISKISLEAQAQLFNFMANANNKRFDNLTNVIKQIPDNLKFKLTENFVAADFGDDFGDSLLQIAESTRLSNNEKARVFDSLNSCRQSIESITNVFDGFDDGEFSKQYARATNERLTDAVTVFREIALRGEARVDLEWAGKPRLNYDSAMEALDYERTSLEIINKTISDVENSIPGAFAEVVLNPDQSEQRLNRTLYNLYSPRHGYVLLYTRPEGSHSFDPRIEYGKVCSRYDESSVNAGVEASISLITNPVNPFELPDPYRPDRRAVKNPRFYDLMTMDKVSAIRLDREGRAPGEPADSTERDPVNPEGTISVDLAAIGDRADTPSGKIARLLSAGNKLRQEASGTEYSLNHNTHWFTQEKYGSAEGFAGLVNYVDSMVSGWAKNHPPDKDANSFSKRMKQARRTRGRKVSGVVA